MLLVNDSKSTKRVELSLHPGAVLDVPDHVARQLLGQGLKATDLPVADGVAEGTLAELQELAELIEAGVITEDEARADVELVEVEEAVEVELVVDEDADGNITVEVELQDGEVVEETAKATSSRRRK